MARKTYRLYTNAVLSASGVVTGSTLKQIELGDGGAVSLFVTIDNGAGAAPSDSVTGTWEAYTSADGTKWIKCAEADTPLAAAKATGNNAKVEVCVAVEGLPGRYFKLRWVAGAANAGNSRATVDAVYEG